MNNKKSYSESESYLKRVLKKRVSFTQGLLVAFLITGAFGLSTATYGAWGPINIDTQKGSMGTNPTSNQGNNPTERDAIILAPTEEGYAESNRVQGNRTHAEIVVIGAKAGALGRGATVVGQNALGAGEQATVVGMNSKASKQSVAIGAEVYAQGDSSIAIGNDDIATVYQDKLPVETIRKIYGDLYKNNSFMSKDEFDEKYLANQGWIDRRIYSPTYSKGEGSIAIGSRAVAYGRGATTLGTLSFALADGSTAIGLRAFVDQGATGGVAMGEESRVFASNSLAVGNRNESTNKGAMSYGYQAKAVGNSSIAIGHTTGANAKLTEASKNALVEKLKGLHVNNNGEFVNNGENKLVNGTGTNGVLGEIDGLTFSYEQEKDTVITTTEDIKKTKKENDNSIAIGHTSFSNGNSSIAVGTGTGVFGDRSIGMGALTYVGDEADDTVAIGIGAYAEKKNNIVLGTSAQSKGEGSVTAGTAATNTGNNNITMGYETKTGGNNSVNIGYKSTLGKEANDSIILGSEAKIGDNTLSSLAIGKGATITGVKPSNNSIALGTNAKVDNAQSAMSLGNEAKADMDNSVALGYRSTTTYKYDPNNKTNMTPTLTGTDASTLKGYVPKGSSYEVDVDSSAGIVSIGGWDNNGKVGLRRLVNVAPGALDSDAATVGQLKALYYVKSESNVVYYTMNEETGKPMKLVKSADGKFFAVNTANGEPLNDIEIPADKVYAATKGANEGTYMVGENKYADIGDKIVFGHLKDGVIASGSDQAVTGHQLHDLETRILGLDIDTAKNTPKLEGITKLKDKNGQDSAVQQGNFKEIVNANIGKINEGITFGADNNNGTKQYLGSSLKIKSGDISNGAEYKGDNLYAKYDNQNGDGTITIGLKENPEFKEMTFKNGDTKPYLTISKDNGGNTGKITGLTDRKLSTNTADYGVNGNIGRAATEGAVKDLADSLNTKSKLSYTANGKTAKKSVTLEKGLDFKDGTNIGAVAEDNGFIQFNLNKELTGITSIANNGTKITLKAGEVNFGDSKVTGVKAGEADTDAVNLKQLKDLGIDPTSKDKKPVVTYDNEDKTTITLGNGKTTKITNLTDAELNATSTDAVAGKQLWKTNEDVKKIETTVNEHTTKLGDITTNITNINSNLNGKANIALDNITNKGKGVIRGESIGAVDVKALQDSGITVAESQTGSDDTLKKTFTVGIDKEKIKEITGTTNLSTEYAKADASNIKDNQENVKKWKEALGVSNLDLSYKADGDTQAKTTTLSDGLTFKGDNNIKVTSEENGKLNYKLNSDLTGITSIANNGTKITLSADNVDFGNKRVTGVAAATEETDAVNLKQLKDLGIDLTETNKKPVVTYDSDKKETITLGNKEQGKTTKITNLTDAELNATSTDAVTGKQLHTTNEKVNKIETTVGEHTNKIENIENNINNTINNSWKVAANNEEGSKVGFGDTVRFKTDENLELKYDETKQGEKALTFGLKDSVKVGKISISSEDKKSTITGLTNTTWDKAQVEEGRAATEGQLKQIFEKINTSTGEADKLNVKYDSEDKTKITLGNGKAVKITNLEDADLSETSTDAVTGKQLWKTNERVGKAEQDIINNSKQIAENTWHINSIKEGTWFLAVNDEQDNVPRVGLGNTVRFKTDDNLKLEYDDSVKGEKALTFSLKDSIKVGDISISTTKDKTATITGLTNTTWDKSQMEAGRAATEGQLAQVDKKIGDSITQAKNLYAKTDASNIKGNEANVKAWKEALGVSNLDLSYKADGETQSKTTTLSNGLTFKGDKNIAISTEENGVINYKLQENLTGIASISNNGTKISLEADGVNFGNKKVTGVADAELSKTSTDAVTGKQLWQTNQNIENIKNNLGETEISYAANKDQAKKVALKDGFKFTNGKNTTATAEDNGVIKFDLNEELEGITSIKGKGNKITFNDGYVDFGNQRLTGIMNGTGNNDAVNISQISPIVSALGGGAKIENGTVTAPTYQLNAGGTTPNNYTTVGDALNALDKAIDNSAKTDASNINKDKYTEALNQGADINKPTGSLVTDKQVNEYVKNEIGSLDIGKGQIAEGDKNTVTGETVHNHLKENYYNKTEVYNKTEINEKLDGITGSIGNIGLNITDSNGKKENVNLKDETLGIKGDKNITTNITTSPDGNVDVNVSLKDDIEVDKVTAGKGENKIEINGGNGSITFGDKENKLTIDGKNNTITNLADGKKDSDAATKGQLDKAVEKAADSKIAFTDSEGNKIVEVDGKIYKKSDVENGKPKDGAKEVKESDVQSSLVDRKGSTKEPTRLGNVAAGKNKTDAVNVGQLESVRDELNESISQVSQEVKNNTKRINKIERSYKKGVANAVATAGVKFQEINVNEVTIGAAVGYYEDQGAVAVGIQGAPTENLRIHGTISATPGPQPEAAASVGFSWKFKIR